MKRFGRLSLAAALLALPLGAANQKPAVPSSSQPIPVSATKVLRSGGLRNVLLGYYTAAEVDKGVYIGSSFCVACHTDKRTFLDTQHSTFARRPLTQYTMVPKRGVIADVNANGKDDFIDGLDFNTISSIFDPYKPNAPKLSVKNGTYLITIAGVDFPVVATLGGGPAQAQRFLVRIPVTDTESKFTKATYFAPFAYDPVSNAYTANALTSWYDANKQPIFTATTTVAKLGPIAASNYDATCKGCHVPGIKSLAKANTGEWVLQAFPAALYAADDPAFVDFNGDGNLELAGIQCESCHGPGSNHVLNGADPTKIVNPTKLTNAQQQDICTRCHASGKSNPAGTFAWPFKDDAMTDWLPGSEPIASYFTDTTAYWPDGKLQKSGRPWGDYHTSLHATNAFENVSCNVCHNIHARTTNERQLYESRYDATTKLTIKTSPENDTFCLSCHATFGSFAGISKAMVADYANNEEAIGKFVSAHTHHPYTPEGLMGNSNCIQCHMAGTGGGHSWRAVAPELTLKYQAQGGMPNSCGGAAAGGCHNSKVNIFGLGLKTGTTWNNQYDVNLATILQKYYGPGGTWWDTKGAPMSRTMSGK
jgi:Doubled CXXCH motif (Paired_CXXCH_1)